MAVDPRYTELELSAVQEIANIGTGNAATALGMLVGRQIDIGVPAIELVPLAEAAERIGPLESTVAAVLTPVRGDAPASLLLALPIGVGRRAVRPARHRRGVGDRALVPPGDRQHPDGSYTTALVGLTGLALEPEPPLLAIDMLGAVVDSVLRDVRRRRGHASCSSRPRSASRGRSAPSGSCSCPETPRWTRCCARSGLA